MAKHIKIAFVWQGIDGRYGQWNDGLAAAMKLVEKDHSVTYHEPSEDLSGADVILYWEAPCSARGKDAEQYNKVRMIRTPKILLFAGGPVLLEDCVGFDMYLVESKINEEEFEKLGLPWMRAFGVNTQIIKPEEQPKVFDAYFPSTCASWKRQDLFARALGSKGVISGRFQETDPKGFWEARKYKTLVLPELSYETVNSIFNSAICCVNTSAYWGGGQRSTLESMASGIPVIAMSDSPKNCEYIEESGCGLICDPTKESIRDTLDEIRLWDTSKTRDKCVSYIQSKWTEKHYADNIIKAINIVLKNE